MNKIRAAIAALLVALVFLFAATATEDAFAKDWGKWQAVKQATFYTDLGATASGRTIKPGSMFAAVDASKVVTKKKWLKGGANFRKSHWYYGQRIQIQHITKKKKPVTVTVADCGYMTGGQYWKGKYRVRCFDLTNAARKKIGITWAEGVGLVRWRYEK